eukprot:Lankesteria_metandrocarpae@DN1797_c0_g1_i1.p1
MGFKKKQAKKPSKTKNRRDVESDGSVNSDNEDSRMQQAEAQALLEEKYARQAVTGAAHNTGSDSDVDQDLDLISRHSVAVDGTALGHRKGSDTGARKDRDLNSLLSHFEASVSSQSAIVAEQSSTLRDMAPRNRKQWMNTNHPEMAPLISDMQSTMDELLQKVEPLTSAALTSDATASVITPRGLQFLECKNQLLLSYLTNLSYYILLKVHGVGIKDHPVVDRLIELRLLIEKLRPVEKRMRRQIDKILTLGSPAEDTNEMRPRPEMLMTSRGMTEASTEGFEEDVGAVDEVNKADGIYRPPKLVATEYTGNKLSERAKVAQMLERQKDKLQRSVVIRRMREELGEIPTEIGVGGVDIDDDYTEVDGASALMEIQRRREEEELDNMTRMAKSSKQTKALQKLLKKKARFGGGATIEDLMTMADEAMDGNADDPTLGPMSKAVKPKTALARYVASARRAADLAEKGRRVAAGDKHVKHREEGNRFVERVKLGGEEGSDDEEEIIDDLASKLQRRRATTPEEQARVPRMEEDVDGRRKISRNVDKNRGLTRKRQKHESNPRVHNRVKYERRLKKHKQLHPDQRPQPSDGGYAGEHTGIRTKVARSTKLA